MLGAAIGAGVGLASSIIGAVSSSKANRKALNLIETQKSDTEAWYNLRKNQEHTQRSDFQAIMKKTKELLDEQYRNARGVSAVTGGTNEAVALQKKAANQALSDTMTNVAGQASAYKDSIDAQYRQAKDAIAQQQVGVQQNQANQVAKAAGQGVSAGIGLIASDIQTGGLDDLLKKSGDPETLSV